MKKCKQQLRTFAADVADIGNRLERIECLLMCSDLKHVQKIDNLLRQLKKDVLEQTPETDNEEPISKSDYFPYVAATEWPQPPHSSNDEDTFDAGVLKVWPSYDERQGKIAPGINHVGLGPETIHDFAPSHGKTDIVADHGYMQQPTERTLEGREPLASDKQAAPASKQATSIRSPAALDTRIEQGGKPVRFWRDSEGIQGQERSVDQPLPPHETHTGAIEQPAQDSAGLTFDVTGALVNEKAAPKQKTSRGWNLAAEAAASGKRIVPKNR